MKAIVTSIDDNGRINLRIRRGATGGLYNRKPGDNSDLKVGDSLEVKRQTNNPYFVRVEGGK